MHLFIATRGIKNWVDQFITELQGKYVPFKYPKDGDLVDCNVQVAVRPIQFWEIVFPEEQRDIMMATILEDNNKGRGTQHKKHEKFIWAIRKSLGIEKIKPYKMDLKMPITRQHIEVIAIGEKKDYWQNIKTEERYYKPTKEQKEKSFEGL